MDKDKFIMILHNSEIRQLNFTILIMYVRRWLKANDARAGIFVDEDVFGASILTIRNFLNPKRNEVCNLALFTHVMTTIGHNSNHANLSETLTHVFDFQERTSAQYEVIARQQAELERLMAEVEEAADNDFSCNL